MVITERAYSGRRYHTTAFSKKFEKNVNFLRFLTRWRAVSAWRESLLICEEHLNLYLHKKCANDGMCVLRKQRNF